MPEATPQSADPAVSLLVWILIAVAICAVAGLLWWILRRAVKAAAARKTAEAGGALPASSSATQPATFLRRNVGVVVSFARAKRFLKEHAAGRDYRYEVPWILMIGARECGASTVLANAGVSAPLDGQGGPTFGQANGIEWWFYRHGLVLNPPGDMVLRTDGRTSDEEGFDLLLNRLIRKGPRRPLDGVVLAVSAEDLLNRSRRAELIGKAAVIRHKLSLIRKRLSMRLPVYVLITKCDQVRGFSAFAAELEPLHGDMFGWSNSYPFDAAFLPDWVDQGFEEMRSVIGEQQMDIFVERKEVPDADGVFLFPAEFQALREPLRAYLTQAFQDNAYEESFFFRGFYFTGDASREPAIPVHGTNGDGNGYLPAVVETGPLAPREIATLQGNRHPVFLHDLFKLKIFPESGLAKPLSRIDMSRNRTVMVAGVLTALFILVAGVGTLSASLRLYSLKSVHLDPLFHGLLVDMEAASKPRAGKASETVKERAARLEVISDAAVNVVSSMGLLSGRRFSSVFIPASWTGHIDREIESGLAIAFQRIVLQAFQLELSHRLSGTDGILKSTTPDPAGAAVEAVYDSPESVPEYQDWTRFVAELKVLEDNIAHYNRICVPGGGDNNDFRSLAKYLHMEANLPAGFNFDNPYFERILSKATGAQYSYPDRDAAVTHAKSLVTGFFDHWYGNNNRVAADVDHMVEQIDSFAQRPSGVPYQQLKDLSDSIAGATEDVETAANEWLSRDQFRKEQFPVFTQTEQGLAYLENFDGDAWTQQEGARTFNKFKEDLRAKSTRLTGTVLDFDVAPAEVSSSVSTLQANLAFLLGQPFVVRDPGPPMQFTQTRLLWDKASLQEAQKLLDSYDRFERGSLRSMPRYMRDVLRHVALDRLQENVLDLVGEAQRVVSQTPANDIEAELQGFTGSLDVLQTLLTGFSKFPDASLAAHFTTLLATQASTMLAVLDQNLQEDNPYGLKSGGFDWWEGEKPLSLAAYEVPSQDALKDYLDRQRTEVQSLANQAEPLVKFLESRGNLRQPPQSLPAWHAILNELKKHTDKKPGNSVDMLEDFVETGLDKIAPDASCQDTTRDPAGRADLFLTIRGTLRTKAVARCRILSQRAYVTQIAELFNSHLAGRFPFSSASSTSSAARQSANPEADPAALADFLNHIDQYGKIALDSLKQNPQFGKSGTAAMEFLSEMGQIRPIFSPFLAGFEKDPVPSFDFNVAFRVNPVKAIDANEVADWGLDVGQQSFRYRGKDNTGNWRLGDPMRVTLRFADDSPLIPVADASQPDMIVNKRVVTFEYTDAWSLFRLLAAHKANRGEIDMQSQKPHLLSFYIPTAPDKTLPQPKDGSVGGLVRVYVQLTVLPPGAKDGVNVPVPFPESAPKLAPNGTTQN